MTPQFTSARRRMVGWSMLVVSLLVLAVGAVTYETTAQSLMQSTDASLSASSAAAQLEINEGEARGELLQQGYRAGLFYLVVGPDGSIVSNPQQLDLSQTPATLWTSGGPRFMTTTINSDTVRIYTRPITSSSGSTLVLIVGQSLLSLQAATQQLLVTLVVGGVFGVLLACAGAWFLATRALGPIQRAFDRQQEFVADASHELRTPLTILHSSADLLAGQTDQPGFDRVQLAQEMRQEVIRMERLTRDLLTLARSDRGELRVAIGRVNLGALADELMRRVAVLADARNIHVERDDAAAAVSVEGDPDRLQEVGLIVLDNALKHTPEGGSIWISVGARGGYGVLQIDDNGEGIPTEHLGRVFERFHRVDRSRSRETGGTGLGLAIAQSVLAAQDGQITVTHRPGGGTRVRIRVPLADAHDAAEHAAGRVGSH